MNKDFLSNLSIKFTIDLFAFASDPFVIFDQDKNLLYANDLFYTKFKGYSNYSKTIKLEDKSQSLDIFFLKNGDDIIPFSQISTDTIITVHKQLLFGTINSAGEENIIQLVPTKIATINNLDIFFMIIINETFIKLEEQQKTIDALITASQLKDNDTGQHVKRVNRYSSLLSSHIAKQKDNEFSQINVAFIKKIGKLAALHDVGKIGVPDSILTKPGILTKKEFEVMKEHCVNGALILYSVTEPMGRNIALAHHEKWDGSGYPYQLSGEIIPLSARIVAIADVYDALRMQRSYKESFSHSKAVDIILQSSGTHFQPELVEAFQQISDEFARIYSEMSTLQNSTVELLTTID